MDDYITHRKNINVAIIENPAWIIYYNSEKKNYEDIVGKFLTFNKKPIPERTIGLIKKAIEDGICDEIKHSNTESGYVNPHSNDQNEYVICWYSSDDKEKLHRLTRFLVDNDLVMKTKVGKLYNISFKYDDQTKNNCYGENFVAK